MSNTQISQADVQAWLANPANQQALGLKYVPRARVNVSANQDKSPKNLLFTDNGKSGALGRDNDHNVYYMANIRGRGRFPQFPLTCSKVGITKDNKLHVEIDFQLASGYETDLAKAWLAGTAKPTLEPAKPRAGSTGGSYQAPTQTEVETEEESTPAPVATTVTTTTVTTAPPASSGFNEASLTMVQKAVRKKAIEVGLYSSESEANDHFSDWKNTTLKELA